MERGIFMHNEKLPESPILYPELPHNLPERKQLIHNTDLVVQAWAMRNEPEIDGLLKGLAITDVIINDCIQVDDINKEFERRNIADKMYDFQQRTLVKRLDRYKAISAMANNTEYDSEVIENEHFAQGISVLQLTTPEEPEFNELAQATTYLRRLFVAREKLAALNGLSKFDTTYYDAVLDELYKEA